MSPIIVEDLITPPEEVVVPEPEVMVVNDATTKIEETKVLDSQIENRSKQVRPEPVTIQDPPAFSPPPATSLQPQVIGPTASKSPLTAIPPTRKLEEKRETKDWVDQVTIVEYTIVVILLLLLLLFFFTWYRSGIRIYVKQTDARYHFLGKRNLCEEEGMNLLVIGEKMIERAQSTQYKLEIPRQCLRKSKKLDFIIRGGKTQVYTCMEETVYFELPE